MKTITTILLFLSPLIAFSQSSYSGTIEPDARVIEAYGKDYIDRLIVDNPFLIQRWNFYVDHAYYITEDIPEKGAKYEEVIIEDLEDFNILKLEKEQKLKRAWDVPVIYKIRSTNKLLVFHPGKLFNEKLRASLKQ